MNLKKNKFIIFYIFNILLLIVILFLAVPASKFLSKINLQDNSLVKNQSIINPESKSPGIIERKVNIKFIAKKDKQLDWEVKSLQDNLDIKIGESKIIKYEGKNLSNKIITSTATFEVFPDEISPYLIKTECFCFTEQTLEPGENKIFTMAFYIDPSMDREKNMKNLSNLVFTYNFEENIN